MKCTLKVLCLPFENGSVYDAVFRMTEPLLFDIANKIFTEAIWIV